MSRLNLTAPVNTLGFGHAAVNLLQAFHDAGVESSWFPIGAVDYQPHHESAVRAAFERAKRYDPNAPSLRVWHQFSLEHHVGRGPHAGWTFFELDRLTPDEVHQINSLDLMFASSHWAKRVMNFSGVTAPVVVAQPGVDQKVFRQGVKPFWPSLVLGPPPTKDTTVFMNVGKWSTLKGMDFLLDVFNAAFASGDDVLLVMCCHHPLKVPGFDGHEESKKWADYYLSSSLGLAGKIRVVPHRLSAQHELAALMAAADAGVFLARGEGWNMPATEMLAMGKEVVLTDCTAHSDYGGRAGARMVEVDGDENAFEHPFLPSGKGCWARLGQKALDCAVEQLRAVHKARQENGRTVNQQGVDLFAHEITWRRCATTMGETLGVFKP